MQPMMVALPLAGIAPITGYCGPGPERTLSGVIAEATIAAEAVVERAAAISAASKTVFLSCIAQTSMRIWDVCVTFRRGALFRWNREPELFRDQKPTALPCRS